jgi:hypothetical protein
MSILHIDYQQFALFLRRRQCHRHYGIGTRLIRSSSCRIIGMASLEIPANRPDTITRRPHQYKRVKASLKVAIHYDFLSRFVWVFISVMFARGSVSAYLYGDTTLINSSAVVSAHHVQFHTIGGPIPDHRLDLFPVDSARPSIPDPGHFAAISDSSFRWS